MIRNVFLVLAAILIAGAGWVAIGVRGQPRAVQGWQEFSIGPAHGLNTTINPNAIRSDGMTLNVMLSVAYAIPRTRILGPEWLKQDRFAITAVVPDDGSESLPSLLQQELRRRVGVFASGEDALLPVALDLVDRAVK